MSKILYEGNRNFELTRKLYSEDEVRQFIEFFSKQKSQQDVQEKLKTVAAISRLSMGIIFIFLALASLSWFNTLLQERSPQEAVSFLCLYVFPLVVLFAGSVMSFRAVKLLRQPFSEFQTEYMERLYQGLIQKGTCQSGQLTEIETLSPTTRRLHFSSLVETPHHKGMQDATFITTSPVELDLSDTVVVLTYGAFRVLI